MKSSVSCACFLILAVYSNAILAQVDPGPKVADKDSKTVIVQFKIFDANKPTILFTPDLTRRPVVFLRNLQNNADELFLGTEDKPITIVPSKERAGFYEITLPRDRLINDMTIDLKEASTNFASITKIVTRDNVVVYPGASKSREDFTFTAYQAQLGRYDSLMTQLTEQFYDRREEIRKVLIERYGSNLTDMQYVLDSNKVSFARPAEQAPIARKTLNDVLVLYGITPSVPTPKPTPQIQQQIVYQQCFRRGRRCR